MFVLNEDLSIYATRGDIVFFSVTAEDDGVPYKFQAGDVVRIKVYGKKKAEEVILEKDFPVTEETEAVEIFLTEEDTKIGEVISKPKDFWYEVELNPLSNPQTIIGYDEDGAKVFKLFPEGADIEDYVPDPEDFKVMDDELDLTSTRPVQNQAIARAMVSLRADFDVTRELSNETAKDVAAERTRIDNLVAAGTVDDAELLDARVDHMGRLWGSAGAAVRGMTKDLDRMFDVYTSPNLLNLEMLTRNKGMSQSGREWDLVSVALTDYIQDSPGQVVVYQRSLSDGVPIISPMRWVCAFDANKNVLSAFGAGDDGTSVTSYTVPDGVSFVRVTLGAYTDELNVNNAMIHLGTEVIPYEKFGTTRTVKIIPKSRRAALPTKFYSLVGHPLYVYFRNVLDYNMANVNVRQYGIVGKQFKDHWEYTPLTAGVYASALQVFNGDYEELNCHDIRIFVKDTSVKNSSVALVIGDSTVDANLETQKMLELASDEDYSLTLLGTRGAGANKHEGRSGWTAFRYVNEEESAAGVKNAFFNPASGAFDFSYYMSSQGYSAVDCVFLQLGINDVFGAQTDEETAAAIAKYMTNMEHIVNSIHNYDANIKVIINLIVPSDADQDKFGMAYGVTQTVWKFKKNTHEANLALIDRFDDVANVYLSPFNAAIDTVRNMSGDVHPSAAGYKQLGAQMYSFMRAIN